MIENVPEAKRQIEAHTRCRLDAEMGSLRKLILEQNNGSRGAPNADSLRDAVSR